VAANRVHRLEGTVSSDLENKAEVAVGGAVMHAAQVRSKALAAAQDEKQAERDDHIARGLPLPPELAAQNDPHIPKMLRRDDSADQMPGMVERQRMTQIDPRTGLGFSTTERLDMPVVPNQERTVAPAGAPALPADAQVTRSDAPADPVLQRDAAGNMVPGATNTHEDNARMGELRDASQARVDEAARQKAAGP
jgi:hypothetical protein